MRTFVLRAVGLLFLTAGLFSAQADTFVVTNANNTGVGSLRWAIGAANSNAVADTIEFNIPGPGPHVIDVATALPLIYTPMSILGDTQPGYSGTPLIEIHGPTPDFFDIGIWLQSSNSIIRGLRATGFTMAGIAMEGPHNGSRVEACLVDYNNDGLSIGCGIVGGTAASNRNIIVNNLTNGINIYTVAGKSIQIVGNFIGVAADGVTSASNGQNGIKINYGQNVTIKGGPGYPQVISGNGQNGIFLSPNGSYVQYCSNNIVQGNFIGVDVTGTNALPNKTGIYIWGGHGNTIGGTSPDLRNIIAGNTEKGLDIGGINIGSVVLYGHHNNIYGNYFGLGSDGETILPNDINVQVVAGYSNRVGGASAGQGNRFGAAEFYNVWIYAASLQAYDNTVAGNTFGLTASTQLIASAGLSGVRITSASNNIVGGIGPNFRNHFAGVNTAVYIDGTNARNNRVIGNWIGVKPDGSAAAINTYGVHMYNAPLNQVGGTGTNEGNLISSCDSYGVFVQNAESSGAVIQGNRFGISASNDLLGSGGAAVRLFDASDCLVGGTNNAARNYFAGVDTAVRIDGTNGSNNRVIGNWIGVKPDGNYAPVYTYGVDIDNSARNQVGGTTTNELNVISGCQWYGVFVRGPGAWGNIVQGNLIGSDPSGTIAYSNRYAGVDIAGGAYSNRIGATNSSSSAMNAISGNAGVGVSIRDSNTYGNVVSYNYIGLTKGFAALSNQSYGVNISQAPGNRIGPGNTIGNSQSTGINISGSNAVANRVTGNIVGTDGIIALHPNGTGIGSSGPGTVIGGSNTIERNIVSGNRVNGVDIGAGGHGAVIQGNIIGLNGFGTGVMSNRQYGISITSADNVLVGGVSTARNYIAGSRLAGIVVGGTASNTIIAGNYIGTTLDGLTRIGNGTTGVGIDANYTTIGLPSADLGNIIAGSGAGGIEINNATNVIIRNNRVGIGADGVTNLPNARGIEIQAGARNVQIGGTNTLDANVVARNTATEIILEGPSAGNLVQGNYVGLQFGGVAFPTSNGGIGIEVINSPSNRILGNVIGQVQDAIFLRSTGSYDNVVQGNFIGEYNLEPVPNTGWGVVITNAHNNVVGGFTAEDRNLITLNNGGILVTGSNAINNQVSLNLIYGNGSRLNIDLGLLGFNTNDVLDADEGPNRLQNRPTLTGGVTLSPSPVVYAQGVLTSAPLTTYAIDVFRSQGTNASAFRFVGRTLVTSDAGGVANISAGFPFNLSAGEYLSATATDPDGNTSELAASPSGVVGATTSDTDNDGIPTYWENLYGLNPAVSNGPASDVDADGFSDYEEYIADTAANDGMKFPVIVDLAIATNRDVTFPSSNLRVYKLEANSEIADNPAWTQIGGSVTGLYGQTTMADTDTPDWTMYRVGVRLP